jgi:hypothetical protein
VGPHGVGSWALIWPPASEIATASVRAPVRLQKSRQILVSSDTRYCRNRVFSADRSRFRDGAEAAGRAFGTVGGLTAGGSLAGGVAARILPARPKALPNSGVIFGCSHSGYCRKRVSSRKRFRIRRANEAGGGAERCCRRSGRHGAIPDVRRSARRWRARSRAISGSGGRRERGRTGDGFQGVRQDPAGRGAPRWPEGTLVGRHTRRVRPPTYAHCRGADHSAPPRRPHPGVAQTRSAVAGTIPARARRRGGKPPSRRWTGVPLSRRRFPRLTREKGGAAGGPLAGKAEGPPTHTWTGLQVASRASASCPRSRPRPRRASRGRVPPRARTV